MKKHAAVFIVIILCSTGLQAGRPTPPFLVIDPVYYYSPDSGNLFGTEINFWPYFDDELSIGVDGAWIFAGRADEAYCDIQAAYMFSHPYPYIIGLCTGYVRDRRENLNGWQGRIFFNYSLFGISLRHAWFSDGSQELYFGAHLSLPLYTGQDSLLSLF